MAAQEFFKGKKVTLMGLGLLGRGVGDARFLAQHGAELLVTDLKNEAELASSLEVLKPFPSITYHLGGHRLEDFRDRDLIIKAAGVPSDSQFVAEAHRHNIPVRMSADLFVGLSGVPVVGVTGTRGKSTVTHMIESILKAGNKEVLLGGNVQGVSTLELLERATQNTLAVLELDSWQLQGFGEGKLSPHVAVFTTFLPDHMNYYHNDLQMYFNDKANIFTHQNESDFLILGEQAAPFIEQYGFKSSIKAHTTVASEKSLPLSWQLKVPGLHNRYNAGIAAETTRVLGIEEGVIRKALESFEGVAGRLQLIKEVRGIKIYNDTASTIPEATVAALRALGDESKKNILLIMGGADKGLNMQKLLDEIPRYCKKTLLLSGNGTERIKKEVPNALVYDDLSRAVREALQIADSGDTIVFSPAFASFGMFKNEYDRGEQFNVIVSSLA